MLITEKLENDMEETRLVIQQLNNFAECLEEIKDKYPLISGTIQNALKNTEIEIGYNEDIEQELIDSIEFERTREDVV